MVCFYQRIHGLEVIATPKMKRRDSEKRVTESMSLSVIEVTFEFEMNIYNGRHIQRSVFLHETCSISVVKSSSRHHKTALKEAYQNFRLFFVEEKWVFFVQTVMNCFSLKALCLW
ncbi:hypothetical protein TNIN_297701 [Trichonephila inaurata madagascariensis]|uniref:Uncharacterized protein n=1 Tax=Trichonephila inaurata madagascariensis TaxID=2747483 RepID=A0A8X7C675_9ARAC|nr:hypothetical protein TNIN_297701 [Trichonephila inaurata madagascariensis]